MLCKLSVLSGKLFQIRTVAFATFVTEYSDGTVPFSPVKYSETTDFHRLHRKNLRNPCNLQLLFKLELGFPFRPNGYVGTPVCEIPRLNRITCYTPFNVTCRGEPCARPEPCAYTTMVENLGEYKIRPYE